MDNTGFYRVELNGEKVAVEFDEIHSLRKDILLYFDDNLEEPTNVLMPDGQFRCAYWKYLSIDSTQEWAESVHYKKLVQEGCLAILNGIALELLDQPIGMIRKEWQQVSVAHILSYIEHFQTTSAKLLTAKSHLLTTYHFLRDLTPEDLDREGMLRTFNLVTAGKWFTKEIIQAYGKWRVTTNAWLYLSNPSGYRAPN
jgi:hypothetical protein